MSNIDDTLLESERSFEDLMQHAAPRPSPSAKDTAAAREAVREEWLQVAKKCRTRKRLYTFAAAASVLLAFTAVFNVQLPLTPAPVQVANIDRSIGAIYVLGDESRLQTTGDLASIKAGQTIVTGNASSLGLTWSGGGSLRLAADSRVLFTSAERIELLSGQIYFDSMDGASTLAIDTRFGGVQHIGTRFTASVDSDSLRVRVREGRVEVDGKYFDPIAEARQQVTLRGNARAEVLDIAPFGAEWEWIEATTPTVSFSGKTVYSFLEWVARETGYIVMFATPELEALARRELLYTEIPGTPRDQLGKRLDTVDLDYELQFEEGVIQIIEREGR